MLVCVRMQNSWTWTTLAEDENYQYVVVRLAALKALTRLRRGVTQGQWLELRIELMGPRIRVFRDNVLRFDITDSTYMWGTVGASFERAGWHAWVILGRCMC